MEIQVYHSTSITGIALHLMAIVAIVQFQLQLQSLIDSSAAPCMWFIWNSQHNSIHQDDCDVCILMDYHVLQDVKNIVLGEHPEHITFTEHWLLDISA